jgi:hypothetical protein
MTDAQHAPAPERRRTERHAVRLTGKIFLPATEMTLDCTVTNLSVGGAEFWCAEPPAPETAMVLYVNGFGRFEGIARRNLEGEVGVKFTCHDAKRKRLDESLAAFISDGMTAVTRLRRSERAAPATALDHFSLGSGENVPCTLQDISLQGASLSTSRRPPIGEVIHLGKTRSWVVRHHAKGIGVQFLEPAAG